ARARGRGACRGDVRRVSRELLRGRAAPARVTRGQRHSRRAALGLPDRESLLRGRLRAQQSPAVGLHPARGDSRAARRRPCRRHAIARPGNGLRSRMDRVSAGSLDRGARVAGDRVRFSVWAPNVERVAVRLVDGETIREQALERGSGDVFTGSAADAGAGTDYFYVLDGRAARPDPVSRHQPFGVHGPSRVVDPCDFDWTDASWRGVELGDLVLYELHVGTFDEAGTFDAVAAYFEALRDLGVTAVELMPVGEFPDGRNWGYDGAHPYAPQSTYGGPEGLRRLVDR